MQIYLIVPVLNNRANAEALCQDFLSAKLKETSLVIVDNGSDIKESLRELSGLAPGLISVISLKENAGFGGGIQAGLGAVDSGWVAWLPGNMKVRPSQLNDFHKCVNTQEILTIVKGKRSGRSLVPYMKTFLASIAQSLVSRTWLFDTGGTPTAVHTSNPIIEDLLQGPEDYTFESFTIFVARLRGMKVVRVKVPYGERLYGASYWQSGLVSELRLLSQILTNVPKWRAAQRLEGKVAKFD